VSRIAAHVYSVERHAELAALAARRCRELGYDNVEVLHGDGTLGWPAHAPYDAIVVAAGGPEPPKPLLAQLRVGGRLVIPVGPTPREQTLLRITRVGDDEYRQRDLGGVRFVPLIGRAAWRDEHEAASAPSRPGTIAELIRESAEPLRDIESAELGGLIDRIGDARVVLLGEATHGTSEFYRMRARITRELIEKKGFDFVAVEADWPDAARIDQWVRRLPVSPPAWKAFTRFPTWMWRNHEVRTFVEWLHQYNDEATTPKLAGFYGLDLYSLYTSISAVLTYLDEVDPDLAAVARRRYGCLSPWEADPATYGRVVVSGAFHGCERQAVRMLSDLLQRRLEYEHLIGERFGPVRFLDASRNAQLVAAAERYYRVMYYGSRDSWNLRDRHMFETLQALLAFHGAESKGVVWEHNSHVGNAAATEMGARGELNIGQLCREHYGQRAFLVGFGTDRGTVAAASNWDAPLEIKQVRPSHPESYEHLCHRSGVEAFLLHLREPTRDAIRFELAAPRLERAIGVIYRPETEMASHYFQAILPDQFDEYIWFDQTTAVQPLAVSETRGLPDTFPFGL
jgi:protein-L-isoaspartate(D-aspartate) O-methyltransferase